MRKQAVLCNPSTLTGGTTVVPHMPVLGEGSLPRGGGLLPFPCPLNPHAPGLCCWLTFPARSWLFSCTPFLKALCISKQHSIAAGAGCEREPETQLGKGRSGLDASRHCRAGYGGCGQAGASAGLKAAKNWRNSSPVLSPFPRSHSLCQLYKLVACLANIDFSPCSLLLPVW